MPEKELESTLWMLQLFASSIQGKEKIMEDNKAMRERIQQLKKEKDAVVLAHYYVDGEVQAAADYVGDSYALSKLATTVEQQNIIFCGVSFMGESAKILNPDKCVVTPDECADCPMAHMVEIDKIEQIRRQYDDVAVVCYVNSTAEIKAHSDVCVTSSNAVRVVRAIDKKRIFFVPDNNLGHYVAQQVPEKEFLFHDGFCHVHKSIERENVQKAKELYPEAMVLTHPECTADVLEISDFIGSTSEIIDYATKSDKDTFIICTEMGILYELEQKNPDKRFYSVGHRQFCPNMKRITLEKLLHALEHMAPEVVLDEEMRKKAYVPLAKMLELAAK